MRAQFSSRDYEQISAYLDGQLSASETRKLEERMQTRPDLRSLLEDLKRTRTLLRMTPHKRAPRNFTLTPAMVGKTGRQPNSWINSLFPAFSLASAIATIALVAAVLFDIIPGVQLNQPTGQQANEVAMQSPDATQMDAEPAAEERAAQQPEAGAPEQPAAEPSPEMGAVEAASPEIESSKAAGATGLGGGDGGGNAIIPSYGSPLNDYAGPPSGGGMGGGGSDLPGYGSTGGPFVIPLEGIGSIEEPKEPPAQAESLPAAEQREMAGGGPILGVPQNEQAGKITVRSAWGSSVEGSDAYTTADGTEPGKPSILGLPGIRLIEFILAVMAVTFGVGAFLLWRRRQG